MPARDSELSDQVRDYCLAHPERFQDQVYCYEYQRAYRRQTAVLAERQA